MTAWGILIVYVVIGCGAGIAVFAGKRSVGALEGAPAAAVMLILWPFLLPTTLLVEALPPMPEMPRNTERSRRIEMLARALHEVWAAAGAGEARERTMLEAFIARLRARESRLGELERAIASAPASARERLAAMREATATEIEQGLSLLDDLVAQLTVLRFSELAERDATSTERVHVEGLLTRIEALAALSAP